MPEGGNLSQNATVSDQNKDFTKPVLPRRKWKPTAVFLPGESHGQRSLVGCSAWGCKGQTQLRDQDAHKAVRPHSVEWLLSLLQIPFLPSALLCTVPAGGSFSGFQSICLQAWVWPTGSQRQETGK